MPDTTWGTTRLNSTIGEVATNEEERWQRRLSQDPVVSWSDTEATLWPMAPRRGGSPGYNAGVGLTVTRRRQEERRRLGGAAEARADGGDRGPGRRRPRQC